jgi:hypothetical protein
LETEGKNMYEIKQEYNNLSEVLMDQKLAKLGDAYVNFLFSLALSRKTGTPTGLRVKGRLLADAFKEAGLRKFLPSRINRHKQADAAEALIVYAWIQGFTTMENGLKILEQNEDNIKAFSILLLDAKMKFEK